MAVGFYALGEQIADHVISGLLEEKGVHNPAQDASSKPAPAEDTGSPERKEKKSLKEKIKDKLHKN